MAAMEAEWLRRPGRDDGPPARHPGSTPPRGDHGDIHASPPGMRGGRMEGRRWAQHGFAGTRRPHIKQVCPPAAATSSAPAWPSPAPSRRAGPAIPQLALRMRGRGDPAPCRPVTWFANWISDRGPECPMSGLAHAASAPHAAGQMRPWPRALAPMAAGSTPATAAMEPSSPSSPHHGETLADSRTELLRSLPSGPAQWAGRKCEPSLGRSAGARLTVMRRAGKARPEAIMAARTRSFASVTALSAGRRW